MNAKQLVVALLVALLALPLGGCMRPIQLSERAIVQAIGVDYADGDYKLTLALYNPKTEQMGGEKRSPLANGTGATVGEALENAKLRQGREIFWGQSKLIIVGKEAAVRGLSGILGFFNDSYEARPSIDVVTTLGEAGEVLRAEMQEAPAISIRNMLENGNRSGVVPRARLMDLVGALESGGVGACTPLVERTEEPDGSERIGISGLALYRYGRYSGSTGLTAARGVLWLRGEIGATKVAVPSSSGRNAVLAVVKTNTRLYPTLVNGVPHFAVECSFQAHLSGGDAPGGGLASMAKEAELTGAEAVRREIEAALEETISRNGTDVLDMALLLRQREPAWYAQNAAEYDSLLQTFTFTVEVKARATRYGLQG